MSDPPPLTVCPLCGAGERDHLFEKDGWPIARCTACDLVYVDAQLDVDQIRGLYGRDYYTGRIFHDHLAERDERVASGRAHAATLARMQPGGRLLDIGSAAGFFLEAASPWYDVTGVEISEFAADYARRQLGHRVLVGDLREVDLGSDPFDVITMWNTVEHVADPASTLKQAARVSRPGSLLVLSTGDVSGPLGRRGLQHWNLMTPPEHLCFFSPATIDRLLAVAGFEIRRVVHDGIVATDGPLAVPLAQTLATFVGLGNVMTVYARRVASGTVSQRSPPARLWARYRPLRWA